MNIVSFFDALDIFQHLTAFLLGMSRLFAVALVAPFLGTGVLEGQIWLILVLGIYLPIHPVIFSQLSPDHIIGLNMTFDLMLYFLCIFIKEIIIGLTLGFLASIPFYAVQDAGIFIDNQRGSSQSEMTEILTGKSVSPMGSLLFQCLVYLYYTSGTFLTFLALIYASYELFPVVQFFPMPHNLGLPLFFAGKVAFLMTLTVLISAPITVACLLVDISLGLVNRFAPQLNAYVLAMPIKSGVAAVLLTIYLALLLHYSPELFQYIHSMIKDFENLFAAYVS